MPLKLIERNRVPARIGNAIHPNVYESTSARIRREQFRELSVTRIFGTDQRGIAVYPHDFGRSLKGAEHDDNSAILASMGSRLCAATGEILVNHFKRTKHPKRITSFGRYIDVSVQRAGRSCDEKYPLLTDPTGDFRSNVFVPLAHRR